MTVDPLAHTKMHDSARPADRLAHCHRPWRDLATVIGGAVLIGVGMVVGFFMGGGV